MKLSRIEDLLQLRETAEKASRIHQNKGMRCFACQGIGHRVRDCPNKRDDYDDASGGAAEGGKDRDWKGQKPVEQQGRPTEDHEDSLSDISEG